VQLCCTVDCRETTFKPHPYSVQDAESVLLAEVTFRGKMDSLQQVRAVAHSQLLLRTIKHNEIDHNRTNHNMTKQRTTNHNMTNYNTILKMTSHNMTNHNTITQAHLRLICRTAAA